MAGVFEASFVTPCVKYMGHHYYRNYNSGRSDLGTYLAKVIKDAKNKILFES